MFEYGERGGYGRGKYVIIKMQCDWCKKKKKYTKIEAGWMRSLDEREKDGWRNKDGEVPDYSNCISFCCVECAEKYKVAFEKRRIDRIAKGCKQCGWMDSCYNDTCQGYIPLSDYTPEKGIVESKKKTGGGSVKVEHVMSYWSNMIKEKYFIRGENDSKTIKRVLASRDGDKFAPDVCYFEFKEALEDGVYYVDCE